MAAKKSGQTKAAGLDDWIRVMCQAGHFTWGDGRELLRQNNRKEEALRELGLPQLAHYGFFESVAQMRSELADTPSQRFILRARQRETGQITRLLDGNLDAICAFAAALPGGLGCWEVEVKEFAETIAAGTIIISPDGDLLIETWFGPHYRCDGDVPKYTGWLGAGDISILWTSPRHTEGLRVFPSCAISARQVLQEYAVQALRYRCRHLRPKPGEPIYLEYGVKGTSQVYFLDVNTSPILTGRRR